MGEVEVGGVVFGLFECGWLVVFVCGGYVFCL